MARIRVALDNFFDESPTNLTKYLEQQMHFKAGFDKKQEYISKMERRANSSDVAAVSSAGGPCFGEKPRMINYSW